MRSRLARVNADLYKHLQENVKKNESNFRVESKRMFNHYNQLKKLESKVKGKRVLIFK